MLSLDASPFARKDTSAGGSNILPCCDDFSCPQAIGFDMDYTLSQYRPETFEVLAYNLTINKLVANFHYPQVILVCLTVKTCGLFAQHHQSHVTSQAEISVVAPHLYCSSPKSSSSPVHYPWLCNLPGKTSQKVPAGAACLPF
jgi:hypothetical protein